MNTENESCKPLNINFIMAGGIPVGSEANSRSLVSFPGSIPQLSLIPRYHPPPPPPPPAWPHSQVPLPSLALFPFFTHIFSPYYAELGSGAWEQESVSLSTTLFLMIFRRERVLEPGLEYSSAIGQLSENGAFTRDSSKCRFGHTMCALFTM